MDVRKILTESTLRTWLEIGGKKQEARYVEKHPRSEQKGNDVLTTFYSRNWNLGSTKIVPTCKLCDL